MTTMEYIKRTIQRWKLHKILKSVNSVAIVGHTSPDADALASILLLKEILKYKYPHVKTITLVNDKKTESYNFIPLMHEIHFVDNLNEYLPKYDLTIFCDHSEEYRFNKRDNPLETNRQIAIDHHSSSETQYELKIVDLQAPAAAQVLVELFPDKSLYQDPILAELAMIGILADSGNMRFQDSKKTNTLAVIQSLIRLSGVDHEAVMDKLFALSTKGVEIYRDMFSNMSFSPTTNRQGVASTYVSRELAEDEELNEERSIASRNFKRFYLCTTKDHPLGYTVRAKQGYFSLSTRCTEDYAPAAQLLAKEFGGGGHPRAGGGKIELDPKVTSEDQAVEFVMKKATTILQNVEEDNS